MTHTPSEFTQPRRACFEARAALPFALLLAAGLVLCASGCGDDAASPTTDPTPDAGDDATPDAAPDVAPDLLADATDGDLLLDATPDLADASPDSDPDGGSDADATQPDGGDLAGDLDVEPEPALALLELHVSFDRSATRLVVLYVGRHDAERAPPVLELTPFVGDDAQEPVVYTLDDFADPGVIAFVVVEEGLIAGTVALDASPVAGLELEARLIDEDGLESDVIRVVPRLAGSGGDGCRPPTRLPDTNVCAAGFFCDTANPPLPASRVLTGVCTASNEPPVLDPPQLLAIFQDSGGLCPADAPQRVDLLLTGTSSAPIVEVIFGDVGVTRRSQEPAAGPSFSFPLTLCAADIAAEVAVNPTIVLSVVDEAGRTSLPVDYTFELAAAGADCGAAAPLAICPPSTTCRAARCTHRRPQLFGLAGELTILAGEGDLRTASAQLDLEHYLLPPVPGQPPLLLCTERLALEAVFEEPFDDLGCDELGENCVSICPLDELDLEAAPSGTCAGHLTNLVPDADSYATDCVFTAPIEFFHPDGTGLDVLTQFLFSYPLEGDLLIAPGATATWADAGEALTRPGALVSGLEPALQIGFVDAERDLETGAISRWTNTGKLLGLTFVDPEVDTPNAEGVGTHRLVLLFLLSTPPEAFPPD